MKLRIAVLALALTGLSSFSTQATTLGFTDYSAAPQHAFWDTFSTPVFTNVAPVTSGGFTGLGLSQNTASAGGGSPFGPYEAPVGDYFYDFNQGSSWDLNFTSTATVQTFVLQIKGNNPGAGTLGAYFNPVLSVGATTFTLDGPATMSAATGEIVFGSFDMFVATYTWTNINIASGSVFNISIDRATGNHMAIDGFNIAAVPEPSTYALMILGLGLTIFFWKRRQKV